MYKSRNTFGPPLENLHEDSRAEASAVWLHLSPVLREKAGL